GQVAAVGGGADADDTREARRDHLLGAGAHVERHDVGPEVGLGRLVGGPEQVHDVGVGPERQAAGAFGQARDQARLPGEPQRVEVGGGGRVEALPVAAVAQSLHAQRVALLGPVVLVVAAREVVELLAGGVPDVLLDAGGVAG